MCACASNVISCALKDSVGGKKGDLRSLRSLPKDVADCSCSDCTRWTSLHQWRYITMINSFPLFMGLASELINAQCVIYVFFS